MYLSAVSAPGTSSEFDELDGKKGGEPRVGEKTVAPATHVVYVLTNLTGLKETVKKKKQKKREKKPHRTNL